MSDSPIKVTIQRFFEKQFLNFIRKQPDIAKAAMTAVAFRFAEYMRTDWLSGQALARITGETAFSVRFFKEKKAAEYGVRPGAGINGRLNYLLKFERGDRPFMRPAAEAFKASGEPMRIILDTYHTKRLKELGR